MENGILPGITREVVLELAPSLGMKAIERKIALEELIRADEAFFTNSLTNSFKVKRKSFIIFL